MSWTNNKSTKDAGLQFIRDQLATSTSTSLPMGVESGSSDQDEVDQFFAGKKVSVSDEDILMRYLKDTSESMENIAGAPCLKNIVNSAEHSSSSECGSGTFI